MNVVISHYHHQTLFSCLGMSVLMPVAYVYDLLPMKDEFSPHLKIKPVIVIWQENK
jgi:hypothetical protein